MTHKPLFLVLTAALACAAAPRPGTGGLAELPPGDVKVLREARDALKRFIEDTPAADSIRRDALRALARVHEALDDWGTPGQLEWYLGLLADKLPGHVQAEIIKSAQAAARGRTRHLANVRALWSRLDASARARKLSLSPEAERCRRALDGDFRYLARGGGLTPTLRPLLIPRARQIAPGSLLKPFKEPKRRR